MCVSINGRGDLDIRPFDLKTGMRIEGGEPSFRILER